MSHDTFHDAPSHAGHDHGHGDHSHGGLGKYLIVGGALAVLTMISFAVGNSPAIMRNKEIGWTMMMAVSCSKAMLVILFFMHLKWEANWKYVLTIPASMMSIFLLLMLMPDIRLRDRKYSEERLLYSAIPATAAEQAAPIQVTPAEPHSTNKH